MSDQARRSVEQAWLRILRTRFPGRRWSIGPRPGDELDTAAARRQIRRTGTAVQERDTIADRKTAA